MFPFWTIEAQIFKTTQDTYLLLLKKWIITLVYLVDKLTWLKSGPSSQFAWSDFNCRELWICFIKGQLISKVLFGILNSPRNKRKNSTLLSSGRLVFVRFLEVHNWRHQKDISKLTDLLEEPLCETRDHGLFSFLVFYRAIYQHLLLKIESFLTPVGRSAE